MKIFVSVGTQKFQFNRLLIMIDKWLENSDVNHEILAQTGYSDYKPKYYNSIDFLTPEKFAINILEADLIITHGGVGTIINSLQNNKKIIVVPRLKKYSEHVDDHQVQIVEIFSKTGYILSYTDGEDFNQLVSEAENFTPKKYYSGKKEIINTINNFLDRL